MTRDGRYPPEWGGGIGARKAGGGVVERLVETATAASVATAATKAAASWSATPVSSTPKSTAVAALLIVVPGKIKKYFVLLRLFVLVVRLSWSLVVRPIQSSV